MFFKKKKEKGFNAFKVREMTKAAVLDKERLAWITWGEEIEKEVVEAASKGDFGCLVKIKMKEGVKRDDAYDLFNPLLNYLKKREFQVLTEYYEDINEFRIRLLW